MGERVTVDKIMEDLERGGELGADHLQMFLEHLDMLSKFGKDE